MSSYRSLGWPIVALLVVIAFVWGRFSSRPANFPPPSDAQIAQLTSAADSEVPTLLTRIASTQNYAGGCQAMVVQSAPDSPPMVVASAEDDDGDEDATHWPLPFTTVVERLKQPITEPTTLYGSNQGLNYRYLLVPLEPTGQRNLLLTAAAEPPSWISPPMALYLAAACLALGLIFAPSTDGN